MISDARRGHVSPGIYTEEKDVTYVVKSLGITSLGLVGETLYGPAFENIEIKDWSEFVDYFGGTSPEKFKGTGLPKYELPYIAKSYLEESKRLNVVRVLGLSGYQAGPCWVLKNGTGTDAKPIVIFRSKMTYDYNNDICSDSIDDQPKPIVVNIEIGEYQPKIYDSVCLSTTGETEATGTDLNAAKKFSITVTCDTGNTLGYAETYIYNISLDPKDSDYIYKVLSSRPDTGNTPVYVEAVYESSITDESEFTLENLLSSDNLKTDETTYQWYEIKYVDGHHAKIIKNLGMNVSLNDSTSENTIEGELTKLYFTNDIYFYEGDGDEHDVLPTSIKFLKDLSTTGIRPALDEYNNYCEMYRPAQTPWFVSEAFASEDESGNTMITTKKLFKFITISDGDAANYQIKVSIQKIDPYKGTFDVVIRDFNDTDEAPVILEKYSNCNLTVGDSSFIGVKIGTSDGVFATKSKYVTVAMASDEDLSGNVPCGFLGFPMPSYGCNEKVAVEYYKKYNPSVRSRKQYFGLNNEIIDTDILKYKGVACYDENGDIVPDKLTKGFHMDSSFERITDNNNIYVDGVNGYAFDSVSSEAVTNDRYAPRIMKAEYMRHTIYKDELLRKFTTYFYGGFDGWDVNRTSRTNTDEYKATNYAVITAGNKESGVFTSISYNGLNETLNLPSTAITSDYYAYLAGYRVFANPQDVDINVFATPGINWYDQKLLTLDAIDMIEDSDDGRGGDALYIMDSPANMSPEEIAAEFEDSDIDTSYACTYYPWIMYFDKFNNQYLNLPPTKDVVRNIAMTDNNSHPWFAPAGIERGSVNCVKANFKTTLAQEDVLYENRINPVKTFGKDGVKIWGNKTAYSTDSPLNRINVRRLMIRVKKLIASAARNLIFEQYSTELDKQFKGIVEPILADVKSNRGIYDYKVITESTPETRDEHILPAKILIKPTPALEYISISFVVYPESVDFQD